MGASGGWITTESGRLRSVHDLRGILVLSCLAFCLVAELGYRGYFWIRATLSYSEGAQSFALYGMGESTMAGVPFEENFSLPDLVAAMLGGKTTGRPIVVHNLARSGWSIYPLLLEFERAVAFRSPSLPGVALIYVGHNEGALADREDDGWVATIEKSPFLETSWILRDGFEALQANGTLPFTRSLPRYKFFLRRTIARARAAGLQPILYTLPSNLSGIEPGVRSSVELLSALQRGDALERSGQVALALEHYRGMVRDGTIGEALLEYRAAHCENALGNHEAARESFWKAVDLDTRETFGRATTAQNAAIREIALSENALLIDAVGLFEAESAHRILGNDLFVDGQHPNLAGYTLLAAATARRLQWMDGVTDGVDGVAERAQVGIGELFDITSADLRRAHVKSGTWLLATAVHHPWPRDRMAAAERHFGAAIGHGDDFSAYAGLAIAQAARHDLLSDDDNIAVLSRMNLYYRDAITVSENDWSRIVRLLRTFGSNPTVLQEIEGLWAAGHGRPVE